MSTSRRQRGLTLVELVIFIVIVGVAVVGVLQVITLNTRNSADPARRKQAMAIAEGLLEEVRLAAFSYCDGADPKAEEAESVGDCTIVDNAGPEAGNTRPFDNVNDYVAAYGTPVSYTTNVLGNSFPTGYTATVTVSQHAALGAAGALVPAGAALLITVSVAYDADRVVLESIRTRYSPKNVSISPKPPEP